MFQTPATVHNTIGLLGRGGKYLRGAVGLTALRFASVGMGLIVTALLSRGLGVTEFGIFAFAISVATLLALPLTGGLPTLLMREIAIAEAKNTPTVSAGLTQWGYRLMGLVSLTLALLAAAAWWLGRKTGLWPWDPKESIVVALVILLVPALSWQQVQRGILSGHQKVVLGGLGEQLFRPTLMVFLVITLGAWVWPYGALGVLGLQLSATLAAILMSFALMRRNLPARINTGEEIHNREWLP
ncbi:polysaccharide biosynthesis protein [Rhodobacter aestuarii]|uniref:Polysaccharide biosynthesis protein n=1 Tax=Rhodobacter aestuarii TaxID=453582 RepID=A0A1N7J011_9RHOB|nr:oligosaccharide flippase family protein [Rhodobacter aestuarii]PTV97337.1 polysaccharide biosynthesis protein [Rhodobacter aestuarii]SIS42624.1 Polysaccharide biosynthesis protein [Rhodobacter aestuarii]